MRIRKLGHSCLLLEEDGTRLLLDPGGFSRGFEELEGLAAVLVTHQHGDHVDPDRLRPLLARNPDARLVVDEGTAGQLSGVDRDVEVARGGDSLAVGSLGVRVLGDTHAVIHPDVPTVPNVGYQVGQRFFSPGDAFSLPDGEVEVLALPTAAPWCKAGEVVDYLRAVAPRVAVPVHDGLLAVPRVYFGLFERLAPDGTTLRVLEDGADPVDL